jgi:hypothetical protein
LRDSRHDAVLYIGSAVSLAKWLGDYQRRISGYNPDTDFEASVVRMLRSTTLRSNG